MLLSDDELCWLALADTGCVGPASMAALRRATRRSHMSLHQALLLGPEALGGMGLSTTAARAAAALPAPRRAGKAILRLLHRLGAQPVLLGRPGYPKRLTDCLGDLAPPVLFVAGRADMLHGPAVAVAGSREPSHLAVRAARRFAACQADAGITIVSGAARGIDTVAHLTALGRGGTVFVPAMGLGHFRWPGARRLASGRGAWCIVSQFPLHGGWHTQFALMRNRTIMALSDAVVAFEPRDSGGTWHTCIQALRARKPLFVVCTAAGGAKARGLAKLVRLGAVALDPARMPDREAFARLALEYRPPSLPAQLSLFEAAEHR